MGQALGALERYELKESAVFVPLDRIEHVADQILQLDSSRSRSGVRKALGETLVRPLSP